MVCAEVQERLSSFLDDELDPWASREVLRHLESCPSCAAALDGQRGLGEALRRDLEYHQAPDLLRARVLRGVRAAARADERPPSWAAAPAWRWAGAAAAFLAVAGAAWMFAMPLMASRDAVTREAVSDHVRSLMASHLTDVASTDSHTVKPWFAGKLDFSPPVTDFAAAGYPLVGGRLDYLEGRSVGALVYQRRKHVINVFVWPDAHGAAMQTTARQGFNVVLEKRAGMAYCFVSDLNATELATFARMLAGASLPAP